MSFLTFLFVKTIYIYTSIQLEYEKKKLKICIITGCSSGLGLEILNKISYSNKNILIYGVARNKKKLELQKKLLNTT